MYKIPDSQMSILKYIRIIYIYIYKENERKQKGKEITK